MFQNSRNGFGELVNLDDSLNELQTALSNLTNALDAPNTERLFELSCEVCLTSRVAWGLFFDGFVEGEKTDSIHALSVEKYFGQAAVQVAKAAEKVECSNQQDLLIRYTESIKLRLKMILMLQTDGPDAVIDFAEKEISERRRELAQCTPSH